MTEDWTRGPAKWAAIVVLGGAAVVGMSWSIIGRQPNPALQQGLAPAQRESTDPGQLTSRSAMAGRQDTAETTPDDARSRDSTSGPSSGGPPASERDGTAAAGRININTAGADELQLLSGVGPVLAARIIEDRRANGPFASVDDLERVKGIGPRTVEKIRRLAIAE